MLSYEPIKHIYIFVKIFIYYYNFILYSNLKVYTWI